MSEPKSIVPVAVVVVACGTLLFSAVAVWTLLKKPAGVVPAPVNVAVAPAPRVPKRADAAQPQWIWSSDANAVDVVLVREFALAEAAETATLIVSVDNASTVLLDGESVLTTDDWANPIEANVASQLGPGTHTLEVRAHNAGGVAAALVALTIRDATGRETQIVSDANWSSQQDDARTAVRMIAPHGASPWGALAAFDAHAVQSTIAVPAGFTVELVTQIKREFGSIVAIESLPDGTLVASPQHGPLLRIVPPSNGSAVSITPIELPIGDAQGLVFVQRGNARHLYANVNSTGTVPSGIYRLRDDDASGEFESVELLRGYPETGGEHGPHGLAIGPDGLLYVIGGNHVPPPDCATSRVPRVWQEDQVLTRMWDPGGHAVGLLAPGGWLVRTDLDAKNFELLSIGMRNAYDIAFVEGEALTFDSDMEWDMGTPWYRPARVLHLASGADYGWRSGSGKFPSWYPDTNPELLDIGPASPTGMLSCEECFTDPKWKHAVLALDWTYGTMHALFVEPSGSGFKATREEFLTGKPLPLTDACVARDAGGGLYFAVGGRGAASAIYRVQERVRVANTPHVALADVDGLRAQRRALELLQRPGLSTSALETVWLALGHSDRLLRNAARSALEQQDPGTWNTRALTEEDTQRALNALLALARTSPKDAAAVQARLAEIDDGSLSLEHARDAARTLGITLARGHALEALARIACIERLETRLPSGDELYDRELGALLVRLGASSAVSKLVAMLEAKDVARDEHDAALLARSDGYGPSVERMHAQRGEKQQLAAAAMLREAKHGWTDGLRDRYAHWFARAQRTVGGNSYSGFLKQMLNDAIAQVPPAKRARFEQLAKHDGADFADRPQPIGPGRHWTTEEVEQFARESTVENAANGAIMFVAAGCVDCHRSGALTAVHMGGPDLTNVALRFGARELAEAIVEPSKVLSDQYEFEALERQDGSVVVGRIVDDNSTRLLVVENVLAPEARVEVLKSQLKSRRPSKLSPMIPGLVDRLNAQEVRDLCAYLLQSNP
ncbi:MAG: c-type cytochrome [Phycisphaerales bacterium]|nr:c-type cytochrome [Phycisphaerales bacterium]